MTSYEFGDVVLVLFPFTDLETHKQRPAVVVNAADYGNIQTGDVIILAITSQIAKSTKAFCLTEWSQAGLLKPSAFKLHEEAKIISLSPQLATTKSLQTFVFSRHIWHN